MVFQIGRPEGVHSTMFAGSLCSQSDGNMVANDAKGSAEQSLYDLYC